MNTESAAKCCGEVVLVSTPGLSENPLGLVRCRSCGDEIKADTLAKAVAAWNRAKSPAETKRPLIKPGNYRSSESVVQALFDDMADRHGFADVLEEISNETAEQVRLAWANILSEDAAHADESRRAEIESDVSKIWQKRTETAYKDALAKVLAGHANGRSLCERAKDTIDALRGDLQASNSQLFDACTARDGLEAELSELRGQDRSKCAEDVRNFSDASDSLTRTVAKLTDELTETQSRADANWHEGERLRGELAAMEAKFNEAHAEGLRVNFLARGKEELAAQVGYTEAEYKRGHSLCGIAVEFIEGLQEQLEAAKASGTVNIHHHYASPAVPQ